MAVWDKVRDWVSLLPTSVTLKNAYRDRKAKRGEEQKKVPQSFTFMAREGWVFVFFLQVPFLMCQMLKVWDFV